MDDSNSLREFFSEVIDINDKLLFKISLVFSLIGSWFSVGFFHPDEQYYAIDFAAYKIGQLDEIRTWEYQNQIRPWLLPTLFIPFLSWVKALGWSPFFSAWVLRVVSAVLGWWTLCQWNRQLKSCFHKKSFYLFFVFATHLSFFCLFMRLRTTSENWSTALFLLGLIPLLRKNIHTKEYLQGGLCFGLAFSLRHQLGIMALGFGLWLLLIKKESPLRWFSIFCPAILAGVGVGVLADSYGYGEWVWTPWNYIYHNLVLDKISNFGTSPFYAYILWGLKSLHLWGIVLLIGLWAAIVNPKSWVAWTIIPFFIVHLLIGHKELRFLFPIAYLLLFQSALFMQGKGWKKPQFANTLIGLNGLFLLFTLFKPAYTPIWFYRYLYFSDLKQIYVFKEPNRSPPKLDMTFYRRPYLQTSIYPEKGENPPLKGHFFTTKYQDLERFKGKNCQTLYSLYPSWIFHLNLFDWLKRSNVWILTKCL